MLRISLLVFVATSILSSAYAQMPRNSDLYLALKKQDSVFFERSFNLCDLAYLEKAAHKDLMFFHDQGGMQRKADFMKAVRENICGNPAIKPIRKVDENSLEVYPLYNDGKLYGAIQHGIHHFYIRQPNQPDKHTSTAKFTHVWLLENDQWELKEVLSYDHKSGQ